MAYIGYQDIKGEGTHDFSESALRRLKLRSNAIMAYMKFIKPTKSQGSLPLWKFLGFHEYVDLIHAQNDPESKISELLEALSGPHGYVIYKTLLAQADDPQKASK